ncbi:MAG TPA: metal ABC transporter ATP-binding protein [Patescibacteria group bacterium]|nr:metal ABC transporter ATP-binding protein [Patescibacteria group bacterium]
MITHSENPAIEVHDATVSYNRRPVLWSVDATVPQGKMVAIVGPNGAGKSTLLKSMMGLVPLASGHIEFFGKALDDVRGRVSYMPQREAVDWDFPTSVFDVVLMGRYGKLGLFKRPRAADKQVAMECLKKVGMEQFAERQISRLSGGQQQRVFLARALAQDADIYLMDEPFAGVDAATEATILQLLAEMRSVGKTIVVVHHDLQAVAQSFDWVLLLNLRLVASGPIAEVLTEKLLQETYGGKLNLLAEVSQILHEEKKKSREKRKV